MSEAFDPAGDAPFPSKPHANLGFDERLPCEPVHDVHAFAPGINSELQKIGAPTGRVREREA